MEISSYLLPEQPAENEVLVTQHLLQLSLFLRGKAPKFPPYFPFLRFSLPYLALIYPATIRQQCQLRDAALEDTTGRLSLLKDSPATTQEGPAVPNVLGAQGWHPGATRDRQHPGRPVPGMGFVPVPAMLWEYFRTEQLPGPAHRAAKESLARADSFLSALKILFD